MKNKLIKISYLIRCIFVIEIARLISLFSKTKKPIWIIGETELQAQENGFTLYNWVKKNAPEIDAYYVLSPKSPLYDKLKGDDHILWLDTLNQVKTLFLADRIISTHGLWMIPNGLGIQKKLLRKSLPAKRVMLNHGIGFLKNGKRFYHKLHFNLSDKIMCLSPKHSEIFLNEYGYSKEDLAIVGYPRFDDMIDQSSHSPHPNLVTFMPTFRDNEQGLGKNFLNTQMYKEIEKLLTNTYFVEYLKSNNITFGIYLHQNIQSYSQYLDKFSNENIIIFRQGNYSVTEILKFSKILVTDYSSVLFDFVYMNKPFISFQFDYEDFISSRKDKAFIDFKKDLPGYVVETTEELVKTIEEIENNQYQISPEHKLKVKDYFKFQDKENCLRVFNAIKDM